ncbi:MAG: PIN domain-containing protein [Candidatus Natronoplasma sp.]
MEGKEKRIVVDTNVLISSLINPESIVWKVLDIEEITFLLPEIAIDELEKYKRMIQGKLNSRGYEDEYEYLLSELFTPLIIVPSSEYEHEIEEAYEIMKNIDEKDTEFLALALAYDCSLTIVRFGLMMAIFKNRKR